jgi:hypothetical protein
MLDKHSNNSQIEIEQYQQQLKYEKIKIILHFLFYFRQTNQILRDLQQSHTKYQTLVLIILNEIFLFI